MLTKMVNMNMNQRENNAPVHHSAHPPPPLPLKLYATRSSDASRQRAPFVVSNNEPEADTQSGPYKAVPAPKPLANPPPYRQPPTPSHSSSPVLPAARPHLHANDSANAGAAAAATATASAAAAAAPPALTSASESSSKNAGHALLAHSSKFPIERELVVTTNDKIAEVGRIERINQEAKANAVDGESAMQTIVAQTAWNEERRTVQQVRQTEVIAGVSHHPSYNYADGYDQTSGPEDLQRPASYMPMHVHYTGWRHENNYVPMSFDGRVQQSQQSSIQHPHAFAIPPNGNSSSIEHSMSFDSQHNGPSSLRDPFAPHNHSAASHLTHYEIEVDSATDRPSTTVTVAPWSLNQPAGDTSTFDRLRDTCNKMFVRDGQLRGSSQLALSPNLPRAMERLTMDQRNHVNDQTTSVMNNNEQTTVASSNATQIDKKQQNDHEANETAVLNNKSGSMRKKIAGKTYHHIKDIFTTKFNKGASKGKNVPVSCYQENNNSASATAAAVAAAAAAAEAVNSEQASNPAAPTTPSMSHATRQPDPIHSINQRIHSQLSSGHNNSHQVWGSYGRQPMKPEVSMNETDMSALARLTLSPSSQPSAHQSMQGQEQSLPSQSPYLRHKPSVTFRMDLNNECQYSGGDNSSSSATVSEVVSSGPRYAARPAQGQIVLYDDTMHFPQHQTPQAQHGRDYSKNAQGEHDSSMSSIASAAVAAGQGIKPRPTFGYSDYDVPPKNNVLNSSHAANEGGSSSGHHSTGSTSDLDKRSGQSVSTNDSGLGAHPETSPQRMRVAPHQVHLDTSTENEMFSSRGGQLNHSSSDWADAADREVNNVLEMRGYQAQSHQQQHNQQSSTPPLPPLSPDASPKHTPKLAHKYSTSKPDLLEPANGPSPSVQRANSKTTAPVKPTTSSGLQQRTANDSSGKVVINKRRNEEKSSNLKSLSGSKLRGPSKSTGSLHALTALQEALDLGEITSTTTGLDLDGDSDSSSSHSDDDLSATLDANESRTIRRQLEGLESMYSEVLKALHKKSSRGGQTDYRLSKRRMYGSVSSLPSSVCSRPVYRDRRRNDDRRKSKEAKSTNKRFQRLESHVVTLARSVAHLSSEMRTQHIMIQEMETIRNEIAQLRTHPLRMANGNPYSCGVGYKTPRGQRIDRDTCWQGAIPALTDPGRVKKLTSFFGDEPPLLRIFLKKLGYEKYAPLFDQEKIGMIELPYLTEERLQKMGIPMGPRIRILQEAQLSIRSDNISDYGMV